MKIFNSHQIRLADKITMERQQISSVQLMERAGYRLFKRLQESFLPVKGRVVVFSGSGNNGGDGLVIARYLVEAGHRVEVFMVNFSSRRSPDLEENYQKLMPMAVALTDMAEGVAFPDLFEGDLVIDAIFGIGLNRRPPGWVEGLMEHINRSPAAVVAVDVPSGLYIEKSLEPGQVVVKADHSFTFELPKLVFLLPDTGRYTGSWSLVPIGQDKEFIASEPTSFYTAEEEEMAALLQRRDRFSHKGHFGHVLVCGGSYGKIGAPLMTAEAALTSGSGLVSALVPRCGYQVLQTAVPEVMCVPAADDRKITAIDPDFTPDVVALGPGLGTHADTRDAMAEFLKNYKGKVVLDADALNILASDPGLWDQVPNNSVITPHPGEFRRLAGDWGSDREMVEAGRRFAEQKGVVLVLKGAYTVVTNGEVVYFNTTGNPGMATGGSGDVLTGVIASLLGQGYGAMDAARLGVYLHGLSGDIAVRQTSQWSLTATDVIDFLGDAFLHLSALQDRR